MSRRLLIILIVSTSVVLLGIVILLFLSKPPVTPVTPPAVNGAPANNTAVNEPVDSGAAPFSYGAKPPAVIAEVDDKTQVRIIASRFAEKYGTYSTDASFANLRGLSYLLTDSLKSKVENVIAASSWPQNIVLPFYGVTTKAVAVKSLNFVTLAKAQVVLTTQRSESFSRTGAPIWRYQDIAVSLEKVDKRWLVGEVEWIKDNTGRFAAGY